MTRTLPEQTQEWYTQQAAGSFQAGSDGAFSALTSKKELAEVGRSISLLRSLLVSQRG